VACFFMARSTSRRIPLPQSREEAIRGEVEDALNATPQQRIEAMVALLDSAYEMWIVRGFAGDEGLCRFPGIIQQRRRGLRRDRRDGGPGATGNAEKDLPDLQRLEAMRKRK